MDDLKKFIDILNPFEWLKQSYYIPLGIKLATLFVCLFIIIFLPVEIKGINLTKLHFVCYWLSAIQLVYLLGYFIQNKLDKKEKEKIIIKDNLEKQLEIKNKLEIEDKKKKELFELIDTFDPYEKDILMKFADGQNTSITVGMFDIAPVDAIRQKGINLKSVHTPSMDYTVVTDLKTLKLLKEYFCNE